MKKLHGIHTGRAIIKVDAQARRPAIISLSFFSSGCENRGGAGLIQAAFLCLPCCTLFFHSSEQGRVFLFDRKDE
jgi:hypothetical protein